MNNMTIMILICHFKTTNMASKVEVVWKQLLQTFVRKKNGSLHVEAENLSTLRRLLDGITRDDVALDDALAMAERKRRDLESPAPVTYIEVSSCPAATLEVFVLHAGHHIPLHDHPRMLGILKVIKGQVQIDSYTVAAHEKQPNGQTVLLARKQTDVVGISDPACMLTPNERNFHAISAVDGLAAFLDILSPPYYCDIPGSSPNPCSFYAEAGKVDSPDTGEKLVKLVEIPMPNEYWCDTAPYRGPPLRSGINHADSMGLKDKKHRPSVGDKTCTGSEPHSTT